MDLPFLAPPDPPYVRAVREAEMRRAWQRGLAEGEGGWIDVHAVAGFLLDGYVGAPPQNQG
jgi:hypothetical protein